MNVLAFLTELEEAIERDRAKTDICRAYTISNPQKSDRSAYYHQTIPVVGDVVCQENQGNQGAGADTCATTINPTNDYAALFAGHCKRCGDHLQPDGACNLCKQPLPF